MLIGLWQDLLLILDKHFFRSSDNDGAVKVVVLCANDAGHATNVDKLVILIIWILPFGIRERKPTTLWQSSAWVRN